jgi:hypothetical protein
VHSAHSTESPYIFNAHLPAHIHSTHSVKAAVAQARAAAVANNTCTHAQPPPVQPHTLHAQYCYWWWHTLAQACTAAQARLHTPRTVMSAHAYTLTAEYSTPRTVIVTRTPNSMLSGIQESYCHHDSASTLHAQASVT